MKKRINNILSITIVLIMLFLTSCSNNVYFPPNRTIELPHSNNIITDDDGNYNVDARYDSNLYSLLERNIWGADEGIIYVSNEQATTGANKLAENKGLSGEEKTQFVNNYINEYADYFFLYLSSVSGSKKVVYNEEDNSTANLFCLKSRDLTDWKLCGALYDGYCLYLDKNTWITNDMLWAAEVIYNPNDGKYYAYFAAMTKVNDGSIPGAEYGNFSYWTSRFAGGVACSETPNGPFYMVTSDNYYNGGPNLNGEMLNIENPNIDVQKGLGRGRKYPVIDLHPTFVDDGNPDTFDLYLYFVRHGSQELNYSGNTIWGVKMKDMITPDYSTLRKLISPYFHQKVEYLGGDVEDDRNYKITEFDEELQTPENDAGGCAEAPTLFMRKDKKGKMKYYLNYSPRGVGWDDYDICMAVADNPLGPYTRLSANDNGIMMTYAKNTDLLSVGHSAYVTAGDQTFCAYGIMTNDYGTEATEARYTAFNEITWYYNSELGYELPIVNGPFRSLQPKPNVVTGYKNVANKAKIQCVNFKDDTVKYLNDGIISSQEFTMDMEAVTTNNKASVSFVFDSPVTLRSVAIYNSLDYYYAFDNVDFITFELADKKQFGNKKTNIVAIKDLPFDRYNYDTTNLCIYQGGASIATFDEIRVKKVTFTFGSKIEKENLTNAIKISEIVLLGK